MTTHLKKLPANLQRGYNKFLAENPHLSLSRKLQVRCEIRKANSLKPLERVGKNRGSEIQKKLKPSWERKLQEWAKGKNRNLVNLYRKKIYESNSLDPIKNYKSHFDRKIVRLSAKGLSQEAIDYAKKNGKFQAVSRKVENCVQQKRTNKAEQTTLFVEAPQVNLPKPKKISTWEKIKRMIGR